MLLYYLAAFLVGMAAPTQAGINSLLSQVLGHPLRAAFVSFAVGMLAFIILSLVFRTGFPDFTKVATTPWYYWVGGLLGCCFVMTAIVVAPRIGATPYMALLICAQLITSVLLDHYGLLGFQEHAINWQRLVGAGLLFGGLALILRF